MKIHNIFIDTQSFMQQGFKFFQDPLKQIADLSHAQKINLIISDIVKHEVESKLIEKADTISKYQKDLLKELNTHESVLFKNTVSSLSELTFETIKIELLTNWNEFLKLSNATILNPNECCNELLLSKYFNGEYPFSKGKKKYEFPDAISLLSLQSWLDKANKSIYVISSDNDLIGYCEANSSCTSLKTIAEFLEIYNHETEKLTQIAHDCLSNELGWLTDLLKDEFRNTEITFDGDGEVDDIHINQCSVNDIFAIEINENLAVMSLQVVFDFDARISGYDYDNAVWDEDDKVYAYIPTYSENVHFCDIYNSSITFTFDAASMSIIEFTDITIEDGSINLDSDSII